MLRLLGRISSINVRKVLWTCSEIGLPVEREDWGGDFASTRTPALDRHLAGQSGFLTGENFTLADIVVGLSVNRWLQTPQNHPDFPSVNAYFRRVSARPAFQQDGLALP